MKPKIAGVILAAGSSRRLGMAKQLLIWHDEPLILKVARLVVDTHLDQTILVTGFNHEAVEDAVAGLPVEIAFNPEWSTGQGSSIRKGVRALKEDISACLFFMCDQPFIKMELINLLIQKYIQDGSRIVAPRFMGKRGNPVIFDRSTFGDLSGLINDEGGRSIFTRYPVEYVEWQDDSILLDVDTIEDYQRLRTLDE